MRSVLALSASRCSRSPPPPLPTVELAYEAPTASIRAGPRCPSPCGRAARRERRRAGVRARRGRRGRAADRAPRAPTWMSRHAGARRSRGLARARTSSVLRQRPGHYYWQAYVTGEEATGLVGPVRELIVTLPAADKGKGSLSPTLRQERAARASTYLLKELPCRRSDGRGAFRPSSKAAAKRWGLTALRCIERQGRCARRLQRRRVLHPSVARR